MVTMAPRTATKRTRKHMHSVNAAALTRASKKNEEHEREALASGLAVMLRLKKVTTLETREAMSARSGWEAMTRQENMLERARQYVGLYVETTQEMNGRQTGGAWTQPDPDAPAPVPNDGQSRRGPLRGRDVRNAGERLSQPRPGPRRVRPTSQERSGRAGRRTGAPSRRPQS